MSDWRLLLAFVFTVGCAIRPAPAAIRADGTIVITQEDMDALARAQATTSTAGSDEVDRGAAGDLYAGWFRFCHEFPLRRMIYWYWLEQGALSLVVPTEEQIERLEAQRRQRVRSQDWSLALQRELDRIDDEIAALEDEREQTLADRTAALELDAPLSGQEAKEAGFLYAATALTYLDAGRAKRAARSLDRAIGFLPNEPLVRALRGLAQGDLGNGSAAREDLGSALASEPRLILALITSAQVHEDALEFGDAADLWERAARAPLGFPRSVERWANRTREVFPDGETDLGKVWSRYFQLRLRLARLRDFAHTYFHSYEKRSYKLVYDPLVATPASPEAIQALRSSVARYLKEGKAGVDRREVEGLLRALREGRDENEFQRLIAHVSDALATAERDVGREIGRRPSESPVVVLYGPAIWQTLIANRWTLGLYAPRGRAISIYMTSGMDARELKNTIYHEYGHFATFSITGPRSLPLWLAEGLAEHLALTSGYDRFAEDSVLAQWREVWAKDPIERPWFEKGPEAFGIADYYKARRAVTLLYTRFDRDGLYLFLDALGRGADLDEASTEAFGMDYRDMLRFLIKRLPSWTGS
jgi:tetratricopeptide (TPR) repeat protein